MHELENKIYLFRLSNAEEIKMALFARYRIRPEDIDATKHFFGAFGKCEVEIAAQYVVRLCQKSGGWMPFSKENLEDFYRDNGGWNESVFNRRKSFPFHWLNDQLLGQRPDGSYCVTDLFIERCFRSSPATRKK